MEHIVLSKVGVCQPVHGGPIENNSNNNKTQKNKREEDSALLAYFYVELRYTS